jgi:hypothetical protein
MFLEIFDVEHGACALVTTSNGRRVMIDCGHNATTSWRPGTFLLSAGIGRLDRLYITNYDEDHVSGYPNLADNVSIGALFRNPSVQPAAIRYLKSEDGMGVGIERLVWSIENVFTGGSLPAIENYGDTSLSVYWNQYGYGILPFSFDDENNLSLVVFITCGQHKVHLPRRHGESRVAITLLSTPPRHLHEVQTDVSVTIRLLILTPGQRVNRIRAETDVLQR